MPVRAPHIVCRQLDIVARDARQIVGAQAGLAVSDGMGEIHEVRARWSDATGLESFPTSLTDRLPGRAFASERAVLEPARTESGSG